jgi:arylsulfatase A-like enzyme
MWSSPLPPEVHDTTFLIDTGIDFMRRHLESESEAQPFFCNISLVDPHDPYDPPEPYASMYDPDDIPEALPAEWKESGPDCLGPRQETLGFDKIANDRDRVQKLRTMYHGSLRYMDDQIGRVIEFVEENGIWENTVILFSTDHGEMMGDHGLITKGMPHYDSGIRVPLIAAGGGIQPGISNRLTCTLDFFPTFCDLAGIPAGKRPPLEGKSFIAHLFPGRPPEPDPYGHHPATPEWDRMLYNEPEWREISVAFGAESVITDDGWRLTRFVQGGGQMFDLNADPDEQNNLYQNPEYAGKRQELLERLIDITTRPHRMPQYRNMPVIDGVPHRLGGRGSAQLIPISPEQQTA